MERKLSSLGLALLLVLLPLASFAAVPSFQSVTNIVDAMTDDVDSNTIVAVNGIVSVAPRVAYVATTGSDSASTLGTVSDPFATLTNAVARLRNAGTVIIRGGSYFNQSLNLTNVVRLKIVNYRGEVPKFYFGQFIAPGSFTFLSNGVWTATMNATFTNALAYLTNKWDSWSPTGRGIFLYQTNTPYGPQTTPNYFLPMATSRESTTNRCDTFPLLRATSVASMLSTTGFWFQAGSTLYVTFANSNAAGGIYLPSTNTTDSFCYGGTDATELSVRGMRSYFGWSGFDVTTMAVGEFFSCSGVGCGDSAFFAGSGINGSFRFYHCEGALNEMEGLDLGAATDGTGTSPLADVIEVGCSWHDNLREGSTVRGNISRIALGSVCFGNTAQFGFIDDGASSTYIACTSASNSAAGFQLGNAALFTTSFQKLVACQSIGDLVSAQLNDRFGYLFTVGTLFDPKGSSAINIAENGSQQFVRLSGSFISAFDNDGAATATLIGGDTGTAARYSMDWWYLGDATPFRPGNVYIPSSSDGNGFGASIVIAGGAKTINLHNDGRILSGSNTIQFGTGSPEGVTTGIVGDMFFRMDGSGTTYTKTNGTGNTGWYDNLLRTHG